MGNSSELMRWMGTIAFKIFIPFFVFSANIACGKDMFTEPDTPLVSGKLVLPPPVCRAKIGIVESRIFMCYNLGAASSSADPFTPGWEINGGYWQWGRKEQVVKGPSGAGANQANAAQPAIWDTPLNAGDWSADSKMPGDPCPAGYTVPSRQLWDAILANNTLTDVGTWISGATNYSSGKRIGNDLFLPAAGIRYFNTGALLYRGISGIYASSSPDGSGAWYMYFSKGSAYTITDSRNSGVSVRCIEFQGVVSRISCSTAVVTGTALASVPATGVSVSIPYSGGNGGLYSNQTILSTGITGLKATLASGTFSVEQGTLNFVVSGTPSGAGNAVFTFNMAGKSCQFTVPVSLPACRAKTSQTEFRKFMCHNLGAANTNAAPLIPGWEVNGAYWQWGRQAQAAAGPSGPANDQANTGEINGWNTTVAPDNSWLDGSKLVNDPCPSGFIVPSKAQWDGVLKNNTLNKIGTWVAGSTNYGCGVRIGNELMLPASGARYNVNKGKLTGRGFSLVYWSSTRIDGTGNSWSLNIPAESTSGLTVISDRREGLSVRCIEHQGSITAVSCGNATVSGTLIAGSPNLSAVVRVPYSGGNGGIFSSISISSTGVTGLVATLPAGSFAVGSGMLQFTITGVPQSVGRANFAISVGGRNCNIFVNVAPAYIGELLCSSVSVTGKLAAKLSAYGVSINVPYTGARGGIYSSQTVNSTGVTGLIAFLAGGKFAEGTGTLVFSVNGVPAAEGTANFVLNIGGKVCTVSIPVSRVECRAKINSKDFRTFMCHNLGVQNTSADPFVPSWEICGGYWQWGRMSQVAAGPDGSSASQTREAPVEEWNTNMVSVGEWNDAVKKPGDPCPSGFTVPTKSQWDAILANNTISSVGAWSESATNYSAGKRIGSDLFLPAAGSRKFLDGSLNFRGSQGLYLSKTEKETEKAWYLFFSKDNIYTTDITKNTGGSVRCIEHSGELLAISCDKLSLTGSPVVGKVTSGMYITVPYTGGNGGTYTSQTIYSTGVEGLVASLAAGELVDGESVLYYNVDGTPASTGVASFALTVGGKTCKYDIPIGDGAVDSLICDKASVSGSIVSGLESTMSVTIPYTGGNGGSYAEQKEINLYSKGIYGYLPAGNFARGDGSVTVYVKGTYLSSVNPGLPVNLGGKVCNIALTSSAEKIESLRCNEATVNGSLVVGKPSYGITLDVPYRGGNGGSFNGLEVNSTGVPGLKAVVPEGNFAIGNGSLSYSVSGTPESAGIAIFTIRHNWTSCNLTVNVSPAKLDKLEPFGVKTSGNLVNGVEARDVFFSLPYSGGNGGKLLFQSVKSTGIDGLTASLETEQLNTGAGMLIFKIQGIPAGQGKANFSLNVAGQTCIVELTVQRQICRARVNNSEYLNFMCHNLGAVNTGANPQTPGWETNGDYWQWGRQVSCATGPSGPAANQTGEAGVVGWTTAGAYDNDWKDSSKSQNDPCPAGYSVPTKTQWDAVLANNSIGTTGSWNDSPLNYSSGISLGNELILPTAGARNFNNGSLEGRGTKGFYLSKTKEGTDRAWFLNFSNGNAGMINSLRAYGGSVRCVEFNGSIGDLYCGSEQLSDKITADKPVPKGTTARLFYANGNGGYLGDYTVNSSGITGLTARLQRGNLTDGNGFLTFEISGNPSGEGKATFSFETGGQFCNITLNVLPAEPPACSAKTSPTETFDFMCHNLGAANLNADPFTPGWEINGAYWQWGIKQQAAAGPAGPGESQTNENYIIGWNSNPVQDGAQWSDNQKHPNDPCPPGYRIPSREMWEAVWNNNQHTDIGSTWGASPTNYSFGKKIGNNLFLPAAGMRTQYSGKLEVRGINGLYWSSTSQYTPTSANAYGFAFSNTNNTGVYNHSASKSSGYSVRCISEKISGSINELLCDGVTVKGQLKKGQPAANVSFYIPYKAEIVGAYPVQRINSIGVRGLTAELAAGKFVKGGGILVFKISGTPLDEGMAVFNVSIGGKTCPVSLHVAGYVCNAKVSPLQYRTFMCMNLGAANQNTDPFAPGWEIAGDYWQWGRLKSAASGPVVSSSGVMDMNDGAVTGWNTAPAPNGAWSDNSKSANDPCPVYYQIPSRTDWNAILANNDIQRSGTWTNSASNFSSGTKVGNSLFLPNTGVRNSSNGALNSRGESGNYWSTTSEGTVFAWHLNINNGMAQTQNAGRALGMSVRCMEQMKSGKTTFTNAVNSGQLYTGVPASGVSANIFFNGGQGESYNGQVVSSEGVGGLVATVLPGTTSGGSGSIPVTISGTPTSSGIAEFNIPIGNQVYTLVYEVGLAKIESLDCANKKISGRIIRENDVSGVTVSLPYKKGNGGSYSGRKVASTNLPGLVATLEPGVLANGDGTFVFTVSGKSNIEGSAWFDLSVMNWYCKVIVTVEGEKVDNLLCDQIRTNGTLERRQDASNVSFSVPYTGGNGASYYAIWHESKGVEGLTATRTQGKLSTGTGLITYEVLGTPLQKGTAIFSVSVNTKLCDVRLDVGESSIPFVCKAKISMDEYRNFMCHNLGSANYSADPFTPGWEINGGYWQYGKKEQVASGPSGPGPSNTNEGEIPGWNTSYISNAWDYEKKSSSDPCPEGYRVPSESEWYAVRRYNSFRSTGSWLAGPSNYSSALEIGSYLVLPAAGFRNSGNGALYNRGSTGYYFSSRGMYNLSFGMGWSGFIVYMNNEGYTAGGSIRCIAE